MAFHLFATIENIDLDRSLGGQMALVDVIATGNKIEAVELFNTHIQDGLKLHMAALNATR